MPLYVVLKFHFPSSPFCLGLQGASKSPSTTQHVPSYDATPHNNFLELSASASQQKKSCDTANPPPSHLQSPNSHLASGGIWHHQTPITTMASRSVPFRIAPLLRQAHPLPAALRQPFLSRASRQAPLVRAAHTIPRPPSPSQRVKTPQEQEQEQAKQQTPGWQPSEDPASEGERPEAKTAYYQMSFTCVPCSHRSHHNISKQGYHTGSILITCPSCRNRHVISDHLNIFGDRKVTVEDLMREKGRLVKRGNLGEDGDIEFWPDEEGTESAEKSGSP